MQDSPKICFKMERSRCSKHPRRWEIWRWSWCPERGETIEDSDGEYVRQCGACAEEEEDLEDFE